jgi:hypothetical protein
MARQKGVRLLVWLSAVLALVVSCFGGEIGATQDPDDDEQSRQVFSTEFQNARPTSPARRQTPPKVNRSGAIPSSDLLGITLWRLRPAGSNDDTQARLLEHEGDSDSVLIAERVSSDTKFKEGQKIRLSIESSRSGYLYVIDREQYADGTFSEPYLIFPTLRINDGDNVVSGGRLVELPDQSDRPFYFKAKRSRTDQVAEVLTLLVTAKPIPNLLIGRRALKLTNDQFAQWQQGAKTSTRRIELLKQVGRTYTTAEKAAGANTNLLVRTDPLPQTIYRITAKPDESILVNISLLYEALK